MKNLLIVKFFLHKTKKQFIAIILMALISAFLLNSVLILAMDYHENYFVRHEETNSPHVNAIYSLLADNSVDEIKNILSNDEKVEQFEIGEYITTFLSTDFNGGTLSTNSTLIDVEEAKNKKIGSFEIIEESNLSGVYLPYLFSVNDTYKIGDTIKITLNNLDFEFTVAGFYSSITSGTYNTRDITLLLTNDCLSKAQETLIAEYPLAKSVQILVRLHNPEDAESYESELLTNLGSSVSGINLIYSINYLKMSSSRYVSQRVTLGILVLSSFFIEIVLLSIISISLSSFCRENIRNLGTLKAMGYTSTSLIFSLVICCTAIGIVTSIVGVSLSYLTFPLLNRMMEQQVGIPYKTHFLLIPSLIAIIVVALTMMFSTFLSVIKMHRIRPIMAIRGLKINVHKSKLVPLHSTKLGINGALTAKTILAGMRRNTVIFISMLLVGIMVGTAAFCYQQSHDDLEKICNLIAGEETDSIITVLPTENDSLIETLKTDSRVKNFYLHTTHDICQKDGSKISVYVTDSTIRDDVSSFCIDGKLPSNDNEIAVNLYYLNLLGLEIGDSITFCSNNTDNEYLICGAIQGAQNCGRDAVMLKEGYERLETMLYYSYFVTLKDNIDVDAFNDDIASKVNLYRAENYDDFLDAISGTYMRVIKLLSNMLVYLCIAITILIVYILVSLLLENKKREHGILKALGFTSTQIIVQTAFTITPISALAVIIGLAVSKNNISRCLSILLNSLGIFKLNLPIKTEYLLICGAFLILLSFGTSCLLSGKIKKIVPHSLFNNE